MSKQFKTFGLAAALLTVLIILVMASNAQGSIANNNLAVSIVKSPPTYYPGQIINYRIRITNPDAVKRDIELVFIIGDAVGGQKGGVPALRKMSLKAFETRTISFRAMAVRGEYAGSSFCMQAWVQTMGQAGSSSATTCASSIDK